MTECKGRIWRFDIFIYFKSQLQISDFSVLAAVLSRLLLPLIALLQSAAGACSSAGRWNVLTQTSSGLLSCHHMFLFIIEFSSLPLQLRLSSPLCLDGKTCTCMYNNADVALQLCNYCKYLHELYNHWFILQDLNICGSCLRYMWLNQISPRKTVKVVCKVIIRSEDLYGDDIICQHLVAKAFKHSELLHQGSVTQLFQEGTNPERLCDLTIVFDL